MKREDAYNLVELAHKRGLNERHFLRPDGKIEAIFRRNQNYLKNGKWEKREDYKLELENGEISNKSDHLKVKVKNNRIKVNNDWFEIEGLYLDNTLIEQPLNVQPIFTNDKVIFSEIFPNIDIEFLITPHRVKETIYIKRNPLIGKFVDGENLYVKYKTSGKQNFSGLSAKDQRTNFEAIEKWDDKDYFIGITRKSLNRAAYPIEIDPTTITPNPTSDVFISAGAAVTDDEELKNGWFFYNDGKTDVNNEEYRSCLRYNLSSVSATITAATFYINRFSEREAGIDHLRQVTAEYDPTTTAAATLWSAIMGTLIGTLPTGTGWTSLSVTTYADTHKGGFCDFGIEGWGTNTDDFRNTYHSSSYVADTSLRPYLSVTYDAGSAVNASVTQVSQALTISKGTETVSAVQVRTASVAQVNKALTISKGTQVVVGVVKVSASITQVCKSLAITAGTQVVAGIVRVSAAVSQVFGSMSLATGTAIVAGVVIASASVTQVNAAMTMTGGTQAVSIGSPSVENWLGTWANRRKITIDHTQFSADLTHFPLPIKLSSSTGKNTIDATDVFTEISTANRKKIAVTKDDGTTQIYAEIEQWDSTNNIGLIWVSKSDWTISSTTDTDIYLYYDSAQSENTTYVGDVGSRSEVWDSNFIEVHHMASHTCSVGQNTSNETGTPTNTTGIMGGKSFSFNGSNGIALPNGWQPSGQNFTVELWHKLNVNKPSYKGILATSVWGAQNLQLWMYGGAFSGSLPQAGGTWNQINFGGSATYLTTADSDFHHVVISYNRTGTGVGYTHCDGVKVLQSDYCNGTSNTWGTTPLYIGAFQGGGASCSQEIDELRISSVFRSDAYRAASYQSGKDNVNTFSAAETMPTGGEVDASVTQLHSDLTLMGGTQSVVANQVVSTSVTQVSKSLSLSGGTQSVNAVILASASISQVNKSLSLTPGTQSVSSVVIASGSVAQVSKALNLTGNTQVIASSQIAAVTQNHADLTITPNTQVVGATRLGSVAQVSQALTISRGTQTVASVQKVSVSQVVGEMVVEHESTTTPSVATVNYVAISQVSAPLSITGGQQTMGGETDTAVEQVRKELTITGGTQSVVANVLLNASVTQVNKSLTITGNTQVIASKQIAAVTQASKALTLTPNTQVVAATRVGSVAQVNKGLSLTVGTQVVGSVQIAATSQVSKALQLITGTQEVAGVEVDASNIEQVGARLTLTVGTQEVASISNAVIEQVCRELSITGGTQSVRYNHPQTPLKTVFLVDKGKPGLNIGGKNYIEL